MNNKVIFPKGYGMKFKEFMSEIRPDIGKLVQTHVLMMIFGIMVYLPIGVETDNRRLITFLVSILTVSFYYYLIDLYMWDVGAKDGIRVRAESAAPRVWRGFAAGLFAAIPDLILGIFYVIFYFYRSYSPTSALLNYIFTLVTRTWEGMFFGFSQSVFGPSFVWFYLITPFIAAAFAVISYYCGTKEFTIIPRPKISAR